MSKPTISEIRAQIKKLEEQAQELVKAEFNDVLADVKEKISTYGFTSKDLGFEVATNKNTTKKTANKDTVVMYRKDDLTWSGVARGRKPSWVAEVIAAGEDIEKYRVK